MNPPFEDDDDVEEIVVETVFRIQDAPPQLYPTDWIAFTFSVAAAASDVVTQTFEQLAASFGSLGARRRHFAQMHEQVAHEIETLVGDE